MTYDEAIFLLKENGINVNKSILSDVDGDRCNGLWQYCPPILSDKYMDKIKEVVGTKMKVHYLPNLGEIHIKFWA